MKLGKIADLVWKRSVQKQLHTRNPFILSGARQANPCMISKLDSEVIISTNAITPCWNSDLPARGIQLVCNELLAAAAEPVGIMATILLPLTAKEQYLRKLMQSLEVECAQQRVELAQSQVQVLAEVSKPVLVFSGVGRVHTKDKVRHLSSVKPGQQIIMTGFAGLEGTIIAVRAKKKELQQRYSTAFLEAIEDFPIEIVLRKEASLAAEYDVAAMLTITEGGIFAALSNLAETSGNGVAAELKAIPIRQETIEISEFFDLNPYMLYSAGASLMVTNQGDELLARLEEEGIPAAAIGTVTEGNDRVVVCGEEVRYLEPYREDELIRLI